jgi:hypothetical protein
VSRTAELRSGFPDGEKARPKLEPPDPIVCTALIESSNNQSDDFHTQSTQPEPFRQHFFCIVMTMCLCTAGPNVVRIEILNWLDSIAPVRQPVFALDHGLSWPRQLVDRWRTPVIEKLRVFIRALPKITQIHSNRVCLATYYTFQPVCALDNLEAWRTPVVEKGKSFYSRVLSGRIPPAQLAVLSQQSLLLFSNMVYS